MRTVGRRLVDDDGSASIEFVTAGVLLLVPIVYLVLAVSAVQTAALGAEAAARQASRVYVQAPDDGAAQERAGRAVAVTLGDYGVEAADADFAVTCAGASGADGCLTRGAMVTVAVEARVALPLVPSVLSLDVATSVPVAATATQQVSRFHATGAG
jgi:hypothetical protein